LVQITNYTSPNHRDHPQVNMHCTENFFTVHGFWATCACPEKTDLPWNFSLYWIYFLHSGFLTTCACPENRVCPEIFRCIEIRSFEQLCACPEKQSCPKFAVLNIFFTFRIFEQPVLSLKNRVCSEIFTCIEISFIIRDFWANCACPENIACPENFQARGGGRPPTSYAYARI